MDPLTHVLRAVRLVSGVFLDARFTAPWCIETSLSARDCAPFAAIPAELIAYHVVLTGSLFITLEGESPLAAGAGEVVLLPHNDAHVLGSAPGLKSVRARDLLTRALDGGLAKIVHGGGAEETHIVCGFLGTEETFNPLLATLPKVLKIGLSQGTSRQWIETSVRFAAQELAQGRLATSDLISRLSEVLLVEAVREFATTSPEANLGWLKGANDPYVGRALALMHQKINAPWTAEALAGAVSLSRSAFIERFSSLVGMPPIRYLTIWRLQTAKARLKDTQKPLAQLAHEVGYDSEEAFSRAFKRHFGLPPAKWRSGGSAG